MKKKLLVGLMILTMSFGLVACGGGDDAGNNGGTNTESNAGTNDDANAGSNDDANAGSNDDANAGGSDEGYVSSVTHGLNYGAKPEEYVGNWKLTGAYTAADGDLAISGGTCNLEIELSIDTNKLVDEAAYTHADATNLKGTMTFDDGTEYSCTGAWDDWTTVNVVGEGQAYFSGAIKFKVRDDDEGIFFDKLTGVTVEDMELFDVLGVTADGKLVLGYSEDDIKKAGDAEWAYAYIFEKAE